MTSVAEEAEIVGGYLIGAPPKSFAIDRFCEAVESARESLSESDSKLHAFMMKHHWSLPLIDAGLAFTRPQSQLRQRIFTMLAILEASPDYHHLFLPAARSRLYPLVIAGCGIRAIARAMLGSLLVAVIR